MAYNYAALNEKKTDPPAPRPPYIGTVVWAQIGEWPFWPSVTVTREWAESQVAEELVRKLPAPSRTNCVVMFFNYDDYIDVVETTNIREFCSSISLVRQAGSYKDAVRRAAQEAIWWLLEDGNGTRTQFQSIRDRRFRRTLSSYGLELVPKAVYMKLMKKKPKPEKKSVFISDDDEEERKEEDPVYHQEDVEEEEDEEEMPIVRKRPQRKARPTKKLVEPSTDSDDDNPELPGNVIARRPSQARRISSKPWRQDAIEVEDRNDHASAINLNLDIDDVLNDTNPPLADIDVDELLLRPSKHPPPIAHKPIPVARRIVKDAPVSFTPLRNNGVQKRPQTIRMSLGSTKSPTSPFAPVKQRSRTPDSQGAHERPRKRVRKSEGGRMMTKTENRRSPAAPTINLPPRPPASGNRARPSSERTEAERRPIQPPRAAFLVTPRRPLVSSEQTKAERRPSALARMSSPTTPRRPLVSSKQTKAERRPSASARMSSPAKPRPVVRNTAQVNGAPNTVGGGRDDEGSAMQTSDSAANITLLQLSASMEEMKGELRFIKSLIIDLNARERRLEAKHDELAKQFHDLRALQSRR